MILSLLFVPLVYGISSTPDACAAPPAPGWDSSKSCDGVKVQSEGAEVTCCWRERVPGQILGEEYCQTCEYTANGWECTQKELQFLEQPPTPPTPPIFDRLPQGILENLPTLEQVPTTPPPLFGRNVESIQPTESIEQPLTSTPPPIFGRNIPQGGGFEVLQESETPPLFGQTVPEGPTLAVEGESIQPMNTTFPTPEPFPPPTPGFKAPQTSIEISPDLAPDEDQDETNDGGNDIAPDIGITVQPESQQPQEPPNEGLDTAGPLT